MIISAFLSLVMTSLVLSLLIIIFAFFSRAFPRLMSSRTRYAIWVIILISLLLPFRPLLGRGIVTVTPPHMSHQVASTASQVQVSATNTLPLITLVLYLVLAIWLAGSLVYLFRHVMQYFKLRRLIQRMGTPVTDKATLALFHNLLDYMQIKNNHIKMVVCSFVNSPMLTGFRHPVILLPEQTFTNQQMEVIIEHELTHYKHRDLLINLLMIVVSSLHWFNPIVRFSNQVIQEEGEILCDEAVLRGKNLNYRRFYGKTILSLIESGKPKTIALSTYFFESKMSLQHRLMAILDMHNPMKRLSYLSLLTSLLLILLSSSVFVLATEISPSQAPTVVQNQDKKETESTSSSTADKKGTEQGTETSSSQTNSNNQAPAASSASEPAPTPAQTPTPAPATPAPEPAAPAVDTTTVVVGGDDDGGYDDDFDD